MRRYHPLAASVLGRFFLGARLRPGNVHTADGGLDFVLPILRWLKSFVLASGFGRMLASPVRFFWMRSRGKMSPTSSGSARTGPSTSSPSPSSDVLRAVRPAEGRTWLHELPYRATSWKRDRRVVLVVVERPDEQQHLFLDHFFLLTSASVDEEIAPALLHRYRQRGSAEADFGDCHQAIPPSLSSAPRPKSHYRDRVVHGPPERHDAFAANEAELLLSLIAANLMAVGAELLHTEGMSRMSRRRFRALLLKTAARVLLGKRRVTIVISSARARLWQAFWQRLRAWHNARGSPRPHALPSRP